MSRITQAAKAELPVREQALALTRYLPPKAWTAQIDTLFKFVRDNVRYTRDVRGVETLQHPIVTLQLRQGDCDDKSMLLASLLESIGHHTRFVAVGTQPNTYQHVLVETLSGTGNNAKWIPLETTKGDVPMGWYPPGVQSRMVAFN